MNIGAIILGLFWAFTISIFSYCEYRSRKKGRIRRILADRLEDAEKEIDKYIAKFCSRLEDNLQYEISSSLEEIDMIDPYQTVTYKKLLKEKHKALVAYFETNKANIRKETLIALLSQIDDEDLTQRVLMLLFTG